MGLIRLIAATAIPRSPACTPASIGHDMETISDPVHSHRPMRDRGALDEASRKAVAVLTPGSLVAFPKLRDCSAAAPCSEPWDRQYAVHV